MQAARDLKFQWSQVYRDPSQTSCRLIYYRFPTSMRSRQILHGGNAALLNNASLCIRVHED